MSSSLSPSLERLPESGKRAWKRHRILDMASIYLPALLMGLLALASYWLLRATPEAAAPAAEQVATHEPDYFMQRFSIKSFDPAGVLRNEISGAEARHHPDTDSTEIDQARIRSINPQGLLTTATAQRVISNDQQTEFVLEGDAVVIREGARAPDGSAVPRMEFRGELLRIHTQPQRLLSEPPVTVLRGNDSLRADALDYQGDTGVALLKGRVKVKLSPQ